MNGTRKLYFENVRVGDELVPLVKPTIDRVTIARYAGAIDEYNPLHLDDDFARRSGFPSVSVPGMLAMGFLGQLASDWLRPGQIKRFSARFVKIIWPGDSLVCRGRIVDKRREETDHYVDLELWVENQRGELVVKGTASTKLFYNPSDEDRFRRGIPSELREPGARPSLVDALERELPAAVAAAVPAPKTPKGARAKKEGEGTAAPAKRGSSRSGAAKAQK